MPRPTTRAPARLALLALTLLLALATSATAKPWALGVRGGLASPWGESTKGDTMSDAISGAVPVQLDLLYHGWPRLHVGGYVSYGPAMLAEDSDDGDVSHLRIGFQLNILTDEPTVSHGWFGLIIGLDQLMTSASENGVEATAAIRGAEYGLQAGYAFAITPKLSIGPVVSASVGRYDSGYVEARMGDQRKREESEVPDDKLAFHGWLSLGLAGTFTL